MLEKCVVDCCLARLHLCNHPLEFSCGICVTFEDHAQGAKGSRSALHFKPDISRKRDEWKEEQQSNGAGHVESDRVSPAVGFSCCRFLPSKSQNGSIPKRNSLFFTKSSFM